MAVDDDGASADGFECKNADDCFVVFYVLHLCRSTGARIRATELRKDYQNWSHISGMSSISFNLIKDAMIRLGHHPLKSDKTLFTDVAFLTEPRSIPDAVALFDELRAGRAGTAEIDRLGLIERRLDHVEARVRKLLASLRPSR